MKFAVFLTIFTFIVLSSAISAEASPNFRLDAVSYISSSREIGNIQPILIEVEVENTGSSSGTVLFYADIRSPTGEVITVGPGQREIRPGVTQDLEVTWPIPSNAVPGTYGVAVTIKDQNGNTHVSTGYDWSFALSAPAGPGPFDFSMSASETSDTIPAGKLGESTIFISFVSGTPQPVSVSCSGMPSSQGTCKLNGQTSSVIVTPTDQLALDIETSEYTNPGQYWITVTGIGGGVTRSADFLLTVEGSIQYDDLDDQIDAIPSGNISVTDQKYESDNKVTVTISGYISNAKNTDPVFLTVTFPNGVKYDLSDSIKENGSFETSLLFENIAWGTYKINAIHLGYSIDSVLFTVRPNEQHDDDSEQSDGHSIITDVINAPILDTNRHEFLTSVTSDEINAAIWDYKAEVLDGYIIIFNDPEQISNDFTMKLVKEGQKVLGDAIEASLGEPIDQLEFIINSVSTSFDYLIEARTNWEITTRIINKDPALSSVTKSLQELKKTSVSIADAYRQQNPTRIKTLESQFDSQRSELHSNLNNLMASIKTERKISEMSTHLSIKQAKVGEPITRIFPYSTQLKDVKIKIIQTPEDEWISLDGAKYEGRLTPINDKNYVTFFDIDGKEGKLWLGIDGIAITDIIKQITIEITPVSFGSSGWFFSKEKIVSADLDIELIFQYDNYNLDKEFIATGFTKIIDDVKSTVSLF